MKYKMWQLWNEIALPYRNICTLDCFVISFLNKIAQIFSNMYVRTSVKLLHTYKFML